MRLVWLPLAIILIAARPVASAAVQVFDRGTTDFVDTDLSATTQTLVVDGLDHSPDPTIVNVVPGGVLFRVVVSGTSSLNLMGGELTGNLSLRLVDRSRSFLGDGVVQSAIEVTDDSELTLACASARRFIDVGLSPDQGGSLNVLGGEVLASGFDAILVGSTGHVKILGGRIVGNVDSMGLVEVRGGTLQQGTLASVLEAKSGGEAIISGGSIGGDLVAGANGTIRVVGRSFNHGFGEIDDLSSGQLTGTLADGTPIDVAFVRAWNGRIVLEAGSTSPVVVPPMHCSGAAPPLSYVALGDSYSSGEGVPPYFPGTDTAENRCHRSTRAYPFHLRTPGQPLPMSLRNDVEFDFVACSGAVTENLLGPEGQHGEPPQIVHVGPDRDLVTLSIGGNDALFSRILMLCLAHESCNTLQPFAPYSDFELGDVFPLIASVVKYEAYHTYASLRSATPEAATIALGYPRIVRGHVCPKVQLPLFPEIQLSSSEQVWMEAATVELNERLAEAAAAAGVHFVSTESRFIGHEVCGPAQDWIHGLMYPPMASFHPNAKGQAELAQAATSRLEFLRYGGWGPGFFGNGLPRNPEPEGLAPSELVGVPTFGRLELRLPASHPNCPGVEGVAAPGEQVAVSGGGFAASQTVALRLSIAGTAGFALGNLTADALGVVSGVVTVPTGAPVGTVGAIEGLGAGTGVGRLVLGGVRIVAAGDSDADGHVDSCDNCAGEPNPSQADSDGDGIGDACEICALDADDDVDGDEVCADLDPCPLDPEDDLDDDGICPTFDNCPAHFNPSQTDVDGDGAGDACDLEICGNGLQTSGEDCDDGNVAVGDGCDASCRLEVGFEPACSNGLDDDGDGAVDLQDKGCSSASDSSERSPTRLCDDGVDNDGDQRADYDPRTFADPLFVAGAGDRGCGSATAGTERPQCDDGDDDDGDGLSDWDGAGIGEPDPQCTAPHLNREAPPPPVGCGIGPEIALALLGLRAAAKIRIRRRAMAPAVS